MKFTCSVCGRITDSQCCPEHELIVKSSGWSRSRDRNAQRKFRVAVLLRDQHKCRRCGSGDDLRAAHWPIPLRSFAPDDPGAYDARNGITLCGICDRKLDPYAR
jgi:hypothetical protein